MNILKCLKCNEYTMKVVCKTCGYKTISTKPPRYSPIDPYGKYRLMHKKESFFGKKQLL